VYRSVQAALTSSSVGMHTRTNLDRGEVGEHVFGHGRKHAANDKAALGRQGGHQVVRLVASWNGGHAGCAGCKCTVRTGAGGMLTKRCAGRFTGGPVSRAGEAQQLTSRLSTQPRPHTWACRRPASLRWSAPVGNMRGTTVREPKREESAWRLG